MAIDFAAAAYSAVQQVEPVFSGVAAHTARSCRDTGSALGDYGGARAQRVGTVSLGVDRERHFLCALQKIEGKIFVCVCFGRILLKSAVQGRSSIICQQQKEKYGYVLREPHAAAAAAAAMPPPPHVVTDDISASS